MGVLGEGIAIAGAGFGIFRVANDECKFSVVHLMI
tara:strand:+ start:1597 stop:1701 length:105 start_codon:yes stop_codon:yes gene_type:complete